jgi:hypothetical protein
LGGRKNCGFWIFDFGLAGGMHGGALDISRHALARGLMWNGGWQFEPGASALRLI